MMRYSCPRNCGWPGSNDHGEWMAHFCHRTSGFIQTVPKRTFADPIAKAVDDYLLMERKARAWDALYAAVLQSGEPIAPIVVDLMNRFVHPAHNAASARNDPGAMHNVS